MAPDPYECLVCQQTYNKENRRPLVLPCNHSFCQRCLQGVKASNTPVCPICRHDLSRSSIKDFVFCHQLVPDEDELKKKCDKKNRNTVEVTREKVRNVCKQHKDDYLFWCLICNCPACKKCLHRMHKNCNWVVLEEHVSNLVQEFGECSKVYSEKVREMHRAGFANRRQLETVKRAIGGLKGLEEQLEMYYGLLASVHGDAEDCLDELTKCKEDAVSGAVDTLVLLKRKVEITAKLQDLLRMPDQPDMPLLHLLENYEASVNMALMPEAKRTKLEFPKTLAGFGYRFKDGKLENVDTGEGFNFLVKENNHAYNQAHYEALGEVMDEHVYALLTHECGLKRVPVPIEGHPNQPSSFIFATENWKTCNRLMILIHGSGVVKAGQWARRLIINDCLNSGTQMPYIHRAKSEGYGVLVLNTNNNRAVDESGRTWPIRGSENPTGHADTVWRQYVMQSEADHIAIVAHSYGGCVATHLFTQFANDFNKRVFAVALTDSVHMIHNAGKFKEFIKRSCNWVTSNLPLDTDLSHKRLMDVPTVSAGVTAHEMTSWGSFNSVFEFFSNRYHDKTNERIPMVSQEKYLFYPPSPPVRQRLPEESVESLALFGQAVARQVAEPMSGANNQGAVGGGDYDEDGQEQHSEEERHARRRVERREPKDPKSDSDSEHHHHHRNDSLEEERDVDEHRRRHRQEVKEKEEQENVSDSERQRHPNERREKGERDDDEVKDRIERRRRRKERRGETEDREIVSDSERNQHSNDGRKEEKRDDDEEEIERRRRRKERRGETKDRESISDSERNQHSNDGRKEEKRDDDKEKIERRRRRKERRGETKDRESIGDSERNHHSSDERKEEKLDDDEEKINRREKRRIDRDGHDSEHSHRSSRGKDQDGEDHSHHSSDKRRSVDRQHGHGASSDSGHSSRRHHKKHERHRSSRNNRDVDKDGIGAESDNGESIHKKKDREEKKSATTGKQSSDDESQQRNEQTEKGGKVEDSQGASRQSDRSEERRSCEKAYKGQQQGASQKGDGGSNAESSGDEEGAGGKNDFTVDQGRSEENDIPADEDMSGDDGKSADEYVSGDEGASCEDYLTPDAMEPDKKSAKDASRHQSESGASDHGDKEDKSVRSKRQT